MVGVVSRFRLQYPAAASFDVQHDEADRGSGKIACPLRAVERSGAVEAWYDPLGVWRSAASIVYRLRDRLPTLTTPRNVVLW
jgi:hypothetical protein